MTGFPQVRTGQQAPEISLPGTDGTLFHLSDMKGKVVLVDFWASWCVPCRRNNPRLVKLYKKYKKAGFEIIGVSIDSRETDWKEAIQHDKLEWIQVNDNIGWESPTALQYGVNAIPASYLIDKEGTVQQIDQRGWALEVEIKTLLKK
ncbi:MAG TPA: TlpA disulfide reductase family protein [Puia sp.]|nr:TlpA disulfide reductase family protein [Puia sp.]